MEPKGEISEADYRELPKRFNPIKFDPEAFVDLARSAGQKYMVFTTKHHDGFCMFDTSYTDYKITNTPYAKDIVALLSQACKKREMPSRLLLFAPRYAPSRVSRHLKALERYLERPAGTYRSGRSTWTTCSCN